MSFDGIKRSALERITAGAEGARLIGAQLTGITGSNIQVLLEGLLARVLPPGGTTNQVLKKTSGTDYAVSWQAESGGSTQPFPDSTALVKNNTDATKLIRVDASGVATSTTRVLTMPNSDVTLANVPAIASQAQADAGTDDATIMTPLKSASASMLRISLTEVSITGATTLTSTAFNKIHVCSGTTADYTVVLPAVAGNDGKIIAFRMSAALTKLVTLDGNASETIDTALTRTMWAQETCFLQIRDGEYKKIFGRPRPMSCVMKLATANQNTANNSVVKINLNNTVLDNGNMADTTNNRINIRRPGIYDVTPVVYWATGHAIPRVIAAAYRSGAGADGTHVQLESGVYSTASIPSQMARGFRSYVAGDYVELNAFQNSGVAKDVVFDLCLLNIAEMSTW